MILLLNSSRSFIACLLLFAISGCQTDVAPTTVPKKGLTENAGKRIQENLYAKPLTERAAHAATGPRFEQLEDCGVEFKNYMLRTRSRLIETGSGVALADYDGDGLIDIYLTGSDVANKLYRNLGNLKFEDVTDAAGVDGRIKDGVVWSSGASFADVDNDGDLDLYVCNMASPNLLFINLSLIHI